MSSHPAEPIQQLHDIKQMMERSSRFISLSGWSGIVAGVCALFGAYLANQKIKNYYLHDYATNSASPNDLYLSLLYIAIAVFVCAFVSAFLFTYFQSKKKQVPIWGKSAQRLMWNTALPIAIGGLFILKLMDENLYTFVAPACLIFYGLGLVNGSKYTLGEVRYLGYGMLVLGYINLYLPSNGLLLWTLGFGVLHIVYGIAMWWKYERN